MKAQFLLLLFLPVSLFAQSKEDKREYDPKTESVYRVNPLVSGGIGVGGMLVGSAGIDRLRKKPGLDAEELDALSESDVWGIDRWGLRQNPEKRESAEAVSDVFFNTAMILPLTLFVDKKFRKDWLEISTMYLETHALNANMYAWMPVGPTFIDRVRPVAYYPEVDAGFRGLGNSRNSFFSGHVSTTAVGTFFFAKVLSDYNPQWTGGQRAIAFTAASLPPLFVAVQRVRSLKHFPSDTVVGMAVGAFFGVMTPQIHKNWQRKHRSRLSIGGNYGDGTASGGIVLTF